MALTESEKRSEKKEKPLTKVVVRRLPPQMTQEEFLNQVSPVPGHNYLYMVKGDMNLGPNAFSRVYINFICPEDIFIFKEKFDNYVFLDSRGNEYPAVVEFAPFQKIPKKRGKNRMDPKCKTIESDSYFLDFVASLNKPEELEEKPEYTLQLTEKSSKEEESTPLLEYIKNKKAQKQKIREMRREEREKKRREYETRKREFHKGGYERKTDEKSVSGKTYAGNKSHKPETEVVGDSRAEKSMEKSTDHINEKPSSSGPKPRERGDRSYEEKRKEIKPRFPKKDYPDLNKKHDDFKNKNYKSKYEDCNTFHGKQEEKGQFPKKVKKYSERREERKMEALKVEQRRLEQQQKDNAKEEETTDNDVTELSSVREDQIEWEQNSDNIVLESKKIENSSGDSLEISKSTKKDKDSPKKETRRSTEERTSDKSDSSSSKNRIRNKDRPTIEIYRPGMLSKHKKHSNEDSDGKKNDGDDSSKKGDA